jgi:hypothetical protein
MPDTLLAKWLKHYDPIHRGWTPAGIANGVCATSGFSFPRIKGGYNLRRSTSGPPGPADKIVGAAGHDATRIRTFPYVGQLPSTTYFYALFAVNGGGVENAADAVGAEVVFDAAGEWIGGHPPAPGDLRVTSLSGGRFHVRWTYSSEDTPHEPAEFRVYSDGGDGGAIDYVSPVAVIAYRRGRFHYEYVSAAFAHGTRVRWAVRAATSTGIEESNQRQIAGWAAAAPPPVNPAVWVTLHEA